MENAVIVDEVVKTFKWKQKTFKALDSVSLQVRKGEIFGLLGPNGAGKTTLINILSTLLVPDSGRAEVFGINLQKSPHEAIKRMNFVSGTSSFHYKETVRSLLEFYAEVYGVRDPASKIKELTKELGVDGLMEREYSHLSTGERTRLHIAKALLNDPELLMLDEPTIGLDPAISVKVREMLKGVNKERGTTILLTSHYMHEVEQLCDRIAFINQGRILSVGTVKDLLKAASPKLDLVIELEALPPKVWAVSQGLLIQDGCLVTKISKEAEVPGIIKKLVSKGLMITKVSIEQPSLEEYFIKMARGTGGVGK